MSDVAARSRAFVFLDRKQAREGLSPAELGRWTAPQAEVASRDLGPRGDPKRGLGLRFVETEGAVREELDALYERALEAAGPRRR